MNKLYSIPKDVASLYSKYLEIHKERKAAFDKAKEKAESTEAARKGFWAGVWKLFPELEKQNCHYNTETNTVNIISPEEMEQRKKK